MKSSRARRARRRRGRVSAPAAASPAFLTSRGRCEACPFVPQINGPVAIADRAPNDDGLAGLGHELRESILVCELAYRNLREFRAPERTYSVVAAEKLALRHQDAAALPS